MACIHKFFGFKGHGHGDDGLIPAWKFKTLIIGTFNPENKFHPKNKAEYFYGRSQNYLWKILPKFACEASIPHESVDHQLKFLIRHEIGLTDLLISINDADENNTEHKSRIQTVLDTEIEKFSMFTWNTPNILKKLHEEKIDAVYFTKLGLPALRNPNLDTFENQMRKIEEYCRIHGIYNNRLFTPSANGLGKGTPKENHLIQRWYRENGADKFLFLCRDFRLEKYSYTE